MWMNRIDYEANQRSQTMTQICRLAHQRRALPLFRSGMYLTQINFRPKIRRSMRAMLSVLKNGTRTRSNGQSARWRPFARPVMVLAWLAFWLNTALFPCCQALAADFGGHSENIAKSIALNHLLKDCGDEHAGTPDQENPHSPCSSFVSASPAAITQAISPAADHTLWQPIAPTAVVSLIPAAPNFATPLPRFDPPPPVRLYLLGLNLRL